MSIHLIEGTEWETNDALLGLTPRNRLRPVLLVLAMAFAGVGAWWFAARTPSVDPMHEAQTHRIHSVPMPMQMAASPVDLAPEPIIDRDALTRTLAASTLPAPASTPVATQVPHATETQIAPLPALTKATPAPVAPVAAKPPAPVAHAAPVAKPAPVQQERPAPAPVASKPIPTSTPTPTPVKQPVDVATKPVVVKTLAVKTETRPQVADADPCASLGLEQAHGATPISKTRLRQIANGIATFHGGCRLTAGSRIGTRVITEIDASTLTIKTTGGPINFFDDGA